MNPGCLPLLTLMLAIGAALFISSCRETPPPPSDAGDQTTPVDPKFPNEIPLLPVKMGDFWRYQVQVEVNTPDHPATTRHETTRTYLGKLKPVPDKDEVDVFEVVIPNSPTERELVEIYEDRILMRGSLKITDGKASPPIWFDKPVPFVLSNIRPGSSFPPLTVADGEVTRGIHVVGREEVTVPAGSYRTIRLLMTGVDGKQLGLELRRTIWFAPGVGIVKELTTRYTRDAILVRQTQELIETNVKHP
ncbi:MAG: DUF3108 domain-containing protein [Akkermansiaceae bacterium]|nr:DUF3108 domain-containing protein [Akkermansiaceae bacterium]